MTDRENAIDVLRLSEPMQKTHSLMETAICIAKRESYLTDEEEATLRKAVELAIKALEQTRWIPVSERLPDVMGTYLVTLEYKEHGTAVTTLWFHNKEIGWDLRVADVVIAWMPLPPRYEPRESEEEK